MSICDRCKNKCKFMLKNKTLDTCSLFEKQTNFDRITASPEALAEFMDKLSYACVTCGEKGPEYYNDDCPFGDFGNCADRCSMLMWLNQESKE